MLAFAWNHRNEVLRWGRSLWTELTAPGPVSPARLRTLVRVLWAGAQDPELRDAKQLRAVRIVGDDVELETDPGWAPAGGAIGRLEQAAGVNRVRVRGTASQPPVSPAFASVSHPAA